MSESRRINSTALRCRLHPDREGLNFQNTTNMHCVRDCAVLEPSCICINRTWKFGETLHVRLNPLGSNWPN